MSLGKLLRDFCAEAYQELSNMGELPRPRYDSPLIAGNVTFTYPLSKLASYKRLQDHMRSSGLLMKLREIGHTWLWHYEVFEWLFLERVLAESAGTTLDAIAFNKVLNRAQAEISRRSFRVRRITTLNGLPKIIRPILLSENAALYPCSNDLPRFLNIRFQDRNREPPLYVDSDNCLLIQDSVIRKGDDGRNLLESQEQLRHQASTIMKVLKLSLDTPVYPKAVYFAYLSGFPMLPILHKEFEEFSGFLFSTHKNISRAEIISIKTNFRLTSSTLQEARDARFFFALDRLSDSFRGMTEKQSIVDLIVALEALLGVHDEELKRRLASNVAFLLGNSDSDTQAFYEHTKAGYKLRNAMVHGGENQERDLYNALVDFYPELKNEPVDKVVPYVNKATEELQRIVRLVLRAYLYMRDNQTREKWPSADELECLAFDSAKRRLIQKQLGITANQPSPPAWHF
jgi:hypothetical protein